MAQVMATSTTPLHDGAPLQTDEESSSTTTTTRGQGQTGGAGAATTRRDFIRANTALNCVYMSLIRETAALLGALQSISTGLVARNKTTEEGIVAGVVGNIPAYSRRSPTTPAKS
jgi:hypothetical protein